MQGRSLEEAEVRYQRALQLQRQATRQLALAQSEQESISSLLESLRKEHHSLKQSFLINKVTHFNKASNKLAALITEAQSSINNPPPQPKVHTNCNQGRHLVEILSDREKEEQQKEIARLQQKLTAKYAQIGRSIQEEMLNEKVLERISKEARRAAKLNTIQQLEKEISKRQGWLQDNKARIKSEMDLKDIQQKVLHNLENLKLLMNKKVLANDYIYDHYSEGSQLRMLVHKMDTFKEAMQAKCRQYAKAIEQRQSQSQLNIYTRPPQQSLPFKNVSSDICQVERLIQGDKRAVAWVEEKDDSEKTLHQ